MTPRPNGCVAKPRRSRPARPSNPGESTTAVHRTGHPVRAADSGVGRAAPRTSPSAARPAPGRATSPKPSPTPRSTPTCASRGSPWRPSPLRSGGPKPTPRSPRVVARICRSELIVIDDIGSCPPGRTPPKRSTASSMPPTNGARSSSPATCKPSGFDTIMPKTLATATVDRLLHHAHLVLAEGGQPTPRRGHRRQRGDAPGLSTHWRSADRPPGNLLSTSLEN